MDKLAYFEKPQLAFTFSFCLLLSLSLGAQTVGQDVDQLVQEAAAAAASGKLEESAELYKQALAKNSSNPAGWEALGSIYYEQGKYSESRDSLRRAAALDPAVSAVWARLGLAEYQVREYDRALESLFRARTLGIEEPTLSFGVSYHQAILLCRFQQFEAGFMILFDLAYQRPQGHGIVEGLGIAALQMPFLPEEVPPDRLELVRMAGRVMSHLADFRLDEARQEYGRLKKTYPDYRNIERADPDRLLQAQQGSGFPVHSEPELAPASEVEIGSDDLVIGVVQNGFPRAYPVNYMNGPVNEVVNDVLGGTPIAATW